MSPETDHYRRTALRTAMLVLALHATVGTVHAGSREREAAPHAQLHSAPESELPGLLERVANAKTVGEARASAAQAVAKLLERGHSDAVTDRALETLGALAVPQAGPILAQYARHRRPAARARALTSLGRVASSDRKLRELVADGLRDSTPEVRAAAARALEALRATEATPLLLRALGRGVSEAAITLGAISDPSSLEAYSTYLNQQPLDVMLSGYARYLRRPDLNERAKLDIVARLEDVAGPVVLQFLSGLARDEKVPASVRQAASVSTLRLAKAEGAAP